MQQVCTTNYVSVLCVQQVVCLCVQQVVCLCVQQGYVSVHMWVFLSLNII